MEIPNVVKIKNVVKESSNVKTYYLDTSLSAKPGQFHMLWLPGVGEKPFVLSHVGKNPAFTIECKGRFTNAMCSMKKGDKIGIRGPYGTGFSLKEKAIVVAGGLGIVPCLPLISKLKKPYVIQGARTKNDLLFSVRGVNVCTDDGSLGSKCFTTSLLEEALLKGKYKVVYACGPEIMLREVFKITEKLGIECQLSLERYMKCGFGVCGSCVCGDRLVCKDGPVFNSKQLRAMKDFGNYAKLKSGKKAKLKEYYSWKQK